ncbi:hypothetical protein TSUD_01160 [Trifolium subterraneum]|nr:hypothetical protein TSUD_01160 [Trifolium subterraneum]
MDWWHCIKSTSLTNTSTSHTLFILIAFAFFISQSFGARILQPRNSLPFIWPLPAKFSFGNETLSVDPTLSLTGNGAASSIVRAGFDRYKGIVFKNSNSYGFLRTVNVAYDVSKLNVIVRSKSEELQLGVDESYNLFVAKVSGSVGITIEANTVFGVLRGLEGRRSGWHKRWIFEFE